MSNLLGIDVGTSSVKAAIFDGNGVIATASDEYPVYHPTPGAAEQNPDAWWQSTINVVRAATEKVPGASIDAISFSGQMHGTIFLDKVLQPVHPAIIWADQRSAGMTERLLDIVGADRYIQTTGTYPAAGFMASTLLWLTEHDPALLERTHRVMFPKDYVRLRMTGAANTDITDAAGSGLFDITQRTWAADIIRDTKLPESIFPDVLPSAAVAGDLTTEAAKTLGLRPGIPVIAGAADQPAQAVGNGMVTTGAASITVGSGGQIFFPVRPQIATDPRLHVFNHAVPDMWYILGAILSAGLSLRWLRSVLGMSDDPEAYQKLSIEAQRIPPGAEGLLFLPYLSGERTPHMDARARGGFIGLANYHQRGHLARAVMEGVAFAVRQALEASIDLGGDVDILVGSGGAVESAGWRSILTDTLGIPMKKTLQAEQAGAGAAIIAGVGAGIYDNFETAPAPKYDQATEPNPSNRNVYDERYAQFCELYPRLKDDFHRLAR